MTSTAIEIRERIREVSEIRDLVTRQRLRRAYGRDWFQRIEREEREFQRGGDRLARALKVKA